MDDMFYVVIHDPNGDRRVAYEGMSQDEIKAMLDPQGLPYEFISKSDYDNFNANWSATHDRP